MAEKGTSIVIAVPLTLHTYAFDLESILDPTYLTYSSQIKVADKYLGTCMKQHVSSISLSIGLSEI